MQEEEYRQKVKVDRRQVFETAQHKLESDIANIRKQIDELQEKSRGIFEAQQSMQPEMDKLKSLESTRLELLKVAYDKSTQTNEANDAAKAKLKQLEKEIAQQKENVKVIVGKMHQYQTLQESVVRLQAQLALREKLLLEVEEKLLRIKLGLDD